MIEKLKNIINKITSIDTKTIGLIIIGVVAISVTYSSAKIIHKNYQLEQEITVLQQQNSLQEQTNKNQKLKNEYYKTDAFLDLAARKFFNKAAPGETLILVPEEVAMARTIPMPETTVNTAPSASSPNFITNWRLWMDFFSGKPIASES
jgi:cell division protein FtsB